MISSFFLPFVFVEKQSLRRIVEKPKEEIGRFISTGIYKLPKNIFGRIEKLSSEGVYDLSSLIQTMVDDDEEINTVIADSWMDIVYPWDLISINEAMIHKAPSSKSGIIEKGVTIKGDVSIGKDTTIYSGCYIVGPVVIGEGCEIGPNTCIFPSTVIGDNSVVRSFTEIRNSVIMNDIHIDSNCFISHSIIGRGSMLGSNYSGISGNATIEIEGEFKKLDRIGPMIGEDSIINSNIVIEPGVIIGRKCKIESMNKISKPVPSGSKVM